MQEIYEKITFRKLEEKDIRLVWDWLNKDYVSQWYHGESTFELQKTKLLKYINGEKPTQAFIVQFDSVDIGYIQCYRNDAYPEYQKEIDCYDDACGIDMFIGKKEYFHKGIGPLMIMKFLKEVAFPQSNTELCILGPDPDNVSAIKAYSKVGFEYMKTVKKQAENEYLMSISKEAITKKINSTLTP